MQKFTILLENKTISKETYDFVIKTIQKLEATGYTNHDALTTHLAMGLERLKKNEDVDPINDITRKAIESNKNLEQAKKLYTQLFSNPPVVISQNEKTYLTLHLLTLILTNSNKEA